MGEPVDASDYEQRFAEYVFERSEEGRAVRVGEKETSEQAAIVARYADLFTRDQLDLLARAEGDTAGLERERLFRLRESCQDGLIALELAERSDALENATLATTVELEGEEIPLRSAQAQLAVIDEYGQRDALGDRVVAAAAGLNDQRLELWQAGERLEAELSDQPDPIARSSGLKGIELHGLASAVAGAAAELDAAFASERARWLERILGPHDERPSSAHVSYIRRLSPLAGTYSKERSVPVCLETLSTLGFDLEASGRVRLDLEDRPQKNPRACVIASRPPEIVHLITRAQGGLADYEAFLHEAGHALHYAGCDPSLPYAFRRLSRDHALTEIYSFLVESIVRQPGWHTHHFRLAPSEASENARAATFIELLLFRRYAAKLDYELRFWSDFENATTYRDVYAEIVSDATGFRYPPSAFLADMDAGFYSADYLRAWVRAAQVRHHLRGLVGPDWWRSEETGAFLSALFHEGTRPTSEEIASRLDIDPLDTRPLVAELAAVA